MQHKLVHLIAPRWLVLGAVLAALMGACASEPDAQVAAVTITTPAPTAPVAIDEFVGLAWEIGLTYRTNDFLVPLSFTPSREGWRSRGADARWVELWFDEDGDGAPDATLTALVDDPSADPELLIMGVLRTDGIRQRSETFERTIGTTTMLVVDVDGQPDPQEGGLTDCSSPASGRFRTLAGYELLQDEALWLGIPACYRTRLWVADMADTTVVMVGVISESRRFDDLVERLEELLESGLAIEAPSD